MTWYEQRSLVDEYAQSTAYQILGSSSTLMLVFRQASLVIDLSTLGLIRVKVLLERSMFESTRVAS